MTDNMEDIHDQIVKLVASNLADGANPLVIAAVLSTTSLNIYKTVLSENEYNMIVDAISDSRNKVKGFSSDIVWQ